MKAIIQNKSRQIERIVEYTKILSTNHTTDYIPKQTLTTLFPSQVSNPLKYLTKPLAH